MKLAFICTEKLPAPSIRGGAIQMMIDGVSPYIGKDHELTVFSISDPELPMRETDKAIEYIRFPRENYRFSVAEELRNHQFDMIHVFNRPKNVPLYKEASPGSKIVLSLHNDMFSEKKLSEDEGKMAIEQASCIMTVSNYIKETIIKRFPQAEEKTKVVYSGVNLESYPPVWSVEGMAIRHRYRAHYRIRPRQKVILFAGRLSKTKGPHVLIQAMKLILKQHPEAVLVIAGGKWFSDDGVNSYVKFLYDLAKPLGNKVIFTKFIPAEEIPNIFLMADVFVCSSQWNEPLARVNYEAMAAGIPLITTNRGGNPEVVLDGFNGLLVEDYTNPAAFANCIHYLFTEPEISEWMAEKGRTFIELNFTYKHVADRLMSLYEAASKSEDHAGL